MSLTFAVTASHVLHRDSRTDSSRRWLALISQRLASGSCARCITYQNARVWDDSDFLWQCRLRPQRWLRIVHVRRECEPVGDLLAQWTSSKSSSRLFDSIVPEPTISCGRFLRRAQNPRGTLVDRVCETSETPHNGRKSCSAVVPAQLGIFNALL